MWLARLLYIYMGMSGPSLLIESTDSMIHDIICVQVHTGCKHAHYYSPLELV